MAIEGFTAISVTHNFLRITRKYLVGRKLPGDFRLLTKSYNELIEKYNVFPASLPS